MSRKVTRKAKDISSADERIASAAGKQANYLDLSNLELLEIPTTVFNLTHLENINLSNNMIKLIPKSIALLSKLANLDISNNIGIDVELETPLPLKLNRLAVSGSYSQYLPDWIFKHKWNSLDISKCKLPAIPNRLRSQTNLDSLDVSENRIAKLPKWFGEIPLTNLDVSSNRFGAFPMEILRINRLKNLDISNNNISNIPDSIADLSFLEVLLASHCGFNSIPNGIFKCRDLRRLNLAYNVIETVNDDIRLLDNLMTLDLEVNKISHLSSNISDLKKLYRLDLRDNNLSRVPKQMGNMHSLRDLAKFPGSMHFNGLHLEGNPLPKIFKNAAEIGQPEATSKLMELIAEYSKNPEEEQETYFNDEIPIIRAPSLGPIFSERDEKIDLEPGQGFLEEPNKARFSSLHEELRQTIDDLEDLLENSSNAHLGLRRIVQRYKYAVNKPAEQTNVDQIYALGLRFESAWQAAQRDIISSFEPSLEDSQQEALTSALRIHAAFVASTREGRELLEASLLYEFRGELDTLFKTRATTVAAGANSTPGLLTEQAGELLDEAVEGLAEGPSKARSGLIGRLTVTNVMTAVAMAVTAKVAGEAFALSHVGQLVIQESSTLFDKSIYFLLHHEREIRLLASTSPEGLGWIRHFIDWLKEKIK